jgi:hypothetical protein
MGVVRDSHVHNVTTCNPPLGLLGDDAVVFVFHQGMDGHVRSLVYIYIFIGGGDVCGRYADDARLIRTSINAPTSVVGFSFQTPQACDHLDLWATFLPGEQGLHFNTKPFCFGTTQTIPSCLVMYPLMLLSLTNLGPVTRLDCGKGQMQHTPARENSFCFPRQAHHGMHEVTCGE